MQDCFSYLGLFWKARVEFRHIGLSNDLFSISSLIKITEIIFFQYCYSLYVGFLLSTLCMLGNFSCFCYCLLTFSKSTFSKTYFRNTIRVSNGLIRSILSVLILVPTVRKGYQQRTKVTASKERVKRLI